MAKRNRQHLLNPDGSIRWLPKVNKAVQQDSPGNTPSEYTVFHLFGKLPYEIRAMIWLLLMPRGQIVPIHERIAHELWESQYEESDTSDSDCGDNTENDQMIRQIDNECERAEQFKMPWAFSNYPDIGPLTQTRLELFGFTSSCQAMPPPGRNVWGMHNAEDYWWDRNRIGHFETRRPKIPVLMVVCREARELMKSHGLVMGFSTRTSNPMMYFNFSHDYLHLELGNCDDHDARSSISPTIDWGCWNIGQIVPRDRKLLKKLSLSFEGCRYLYGDTVPEALHMAVQLFGGLNELLLIEREDVSLWRQPNQEHVIIEMGMEDLLGHYPGWTPTISNDYWAYEPRGFLMEHSIVPLDAISRDMEKQIRNHKPLTSSPKAWSTPKISFVTLMGRKAADDLEASRRHFRTDVAEWLHDPHLHRLPANLNTMKAARQYCKSRKAYYKTKSLEWFDSAKIMVDTISDISRWWNSEEDDGNWYCDSDSDEAINEGDNDAYDDDGADEGEQDAEMDD